MKRSTRPLKRTPLKRVSSKRAKEMKQYSSMRETFMRARPMDEAWLLVAGFSMEEIKDIQAKAVIALWEGRNPAAVFTKNETNMLLLGLPQICPRSEDLHHVKKRGKYYLDESTWLAVGRKIHQHIHDAPGWARAEGLLA